MQIVIDILEQDYERAVHGRIPVVRMRNAIRNGTILPRGHGKLSTMYYIAENMRLNKPISEEWYKYFRMAIKAVEQGPCEDTINRFAKKSGG